MQLPNTLKVIKMLLFKVLPIGVKLTVSWDLVGMMYARECTEDRVIERADDVVRELFPLWAGNMVLDVDA